MLKSALVFYCVYLGSMPGFARSFANYQQLQTDRNFMMATSITIPHIPSVYNIHSVKNGNVLEVFDAIGPHEEKYDLPVIDQVLQSVSISGDNTMLACGGGVYGAEVGLYRVGNPHRLATLANTTFYNTLLFSRDKKYLVMKPDNLSGWPIQVFDIASQKPLEALYGEERAMWKSLTVSAVENIAAAGSNDWLVWMWPNFNADDPILLPGHLSSVNAVSFSPDGKLLASGGADGNVMIWNIDTKSMLRTINTGLKKSTVDIKRASKHGQDVVPFDPDVENGVASLAWTADGKTLVVGGRWLGEIRIVDVQSGIVEQELIINSGNKIELVTFSADNRYLLAQYSQNFVRIYENIPEGTIFESVIQKEPQNIFLTTLKILIPWAMKN